MINIAFRESYTFNLPWFNSLILSCFNRCILCTCLFCIFLTEAWSCYSTDVVDTNKNWSDLLTFMKISFSHKVQFERYWSKHSCLYFCISLFWKWQCRSDRCVWESLHDFGLVIWNLYHWIHMIIAMSKINLAFRQLLCFYGW